VAQCQLDGCRFTFRYEGDIYEVLTYEDDANYIGISALYRLPKGVSRAAVMRAANEITRRSKVTKAYLQPDRALTIAFEMMVDDPARLNPLFHRVMRSLQSAANELFRQVAESKTR